METSGGATTIIMGNTKAKDYYRRAGFGSFSIRNRPGIRNRTNILQIREHDLTINDIVELIVYPELVLRTKPWRFWGKVARFLNDTVILRQVDGEQAGTIIRIPYRYFEDGRVYRRVVSDESEE